MRVGVVGHRYLSLDSREFAGAACVDVLTSLRRTSAELTAVSALAEGADTLFAGAAVALDLPLDVVRPHDEYRLDFQTHAARDDFDRLWLLARRRMLLPSPSASSEAYRTAMRWVADNCDVLVAIWDGRPSVHVGGTAQTVAYARSRGRPVILVPTRSADACCV
jgi:hypothetical protein